MQIWTGNKSFRGDRPYPAGPWMDEPDKAHWVDAESDLDCLIVRGPAGALCGYVGVPPEHPWHGYLDSECTLMPACSGIYCDHSVSSYVRAHGGLTFAAACRETGDPGTGICHVPLPGRTGDIWWFGFDCNHGGLDYSPMDLFFTETMDLPAEVAYSGTYKDFDYVRVECARLAGQLAKAAE